MAEFAVPAEYRAIQAEKEVERLRAAIKQHHDQRADDRCWLDDVALYQAAGLLPGDNTVGDKEAMLANCKRFVEHRCQGGGPWPSYASLEAKIQRIQAACGIPDAQEACRVILELCKKKPE